jgi:hypothetical protein
MPLQRHPEQQCSASYRWLLWLIRPGLQSMLTFVPLGLPLQR